MKLSPKEKIAIQRENVGIKNQLNAGGLKIKEKISLQRLWKANLKTLGAQVKTSETAEPQAGLIIDDYLAGKFSAVALTQFMEVMDSVEAAGADLDQVKVGAKLWAEANETLLAA
jgi:hypothetical protein